jgi:hypothetical protein
MATRLANPAPQFFYNGTPAAPLSGGLMYFYEPGSSLTPKDTYSNNTLTTENTNPVVLSASGVLPNVFLDGAYRVVLKDKDGVQQWDRDSVNSISELSFADWDATINYGVGGTNIVYASNGFYYVSIDTPNLGNEPSASPLFWRLAIDYFLESQTAIEPGHIGVGGSPGGIVSLNTKTKGTIAVGNGTTTTSLAAGTNTHVLTANSSATNGIEWAAIPDTERDYQAFTTSGTWTKPAAAEFVLVQAWAGGGGGANNTASSANESGGSGGEYVWQIFQASALGATETVTIGAGGAGAANASTANGSAGGTTTFGSLLSAIGGNPGQTGGGTTYITIPRSLATTSAISGSPYGVLVCTQAGPGSTAGGGKTIYGGGGGGGSDTGGSVGGASEFGGDGGGGNNTLNTAATAGSAPAGGGGGSGNNGGGGAGGRGEVRVWTW